MTDDPGGITPLINATVGGFLSILFLLLPLTIIMGGREPFIDKVNVHHLQQN